MVDIRTYHALITLAENNMRVIHWKLCGDDFNITHERYGKYYDELGNMMDECAEQMITIGINPVSMMEAVEILKSDSDVHAIVMDPSINYDASSADRAAIEMFTQLHTIANQLSCDSNLPCDVQDVILDHAKWFRIEGLYKLGRTVAIANVQKSTTEDVEVIPNKDEPLDDGGISDVPVDSERENTIIEPDDDIINEE